MSRTQNYILCFEGSFDFPYELHQYQCGGFVLQTTFVIDFPTQLSLFIIEPTNQ